MEDRKLRMEGAAFAARLERLYGAEGAAEARTRCCEVVAGFEKTFESEPEALFSAPGRTELGGNHTDHQHGRVLAAAVDLDILAAVAPNQSGMIRVQSQGYPLMVVDLSDRPHERHGLPPAERGPGRLHGLQRARRQRPFLLRRL